MTASQFQTVEIGSVLEKVTKPVAVDPAAFYQEIGIRSHGKGLFDKEPVAGATLGDKRVFWVEPNCFILNIVFAWERAVGKTTEAELGKIASHRFPMYRPIDGKADLNFITYFFKTEFGRELLSLASPGGAGRNKTLGQNEFLKLKVRLPPYGEQRKIGAILSTWDQAIETAEALVANAREHKAALMQALLTGRRRLPGFAWSWRQVTLGELGTFRKGKGISRAEVRSSGLPCVRYGEIYTLHHDLIQDFGSFIDAASASLSQPIERGDILFACSGETAEEIGKCVTFDGPERAYAGGDIIVFRPREQSSIFLTYLLNSPKLAIQKAQMGQGNAVVHISASNLAKLRFAIPDHTEQDAIAEYLLTADALVRNHMAKLVALKSEKAALMQQLLIGKRRVSGAESEAA